MQLDKFRVNSGRNSIKIAGSRGSRAASSGPLTQSQSEWESQTRKIENMEQRWSPHCEYTIGERQSPTDLHSLRGIHLSPFFLYFVDFTLSPNRVDKTVALPPNAALSFGWDCVLWSDIPSHLNIAAAVVSHDLCLWFASGPFLGSPLDSP